MLPEKFKDRMAKLLGDEATAFFDELELAKAEKALRVNKIKVDSNEDAIATLKVTKIPYLLADGQVFKRDTYRC